MQESVQFQYSADETYVSVHPWSEDRPQALVICCSDGRWHAHIEDFMRRCVPGGVRADLYAIPGGPAAFNWMTASLIEASSLETSLRFLYDHHKLRSVWLIAHDGCVFYAAKRAGHSGEQLRSAQIDDLEHAASRVRTWYPDLTVIRVYAKLIDGSVRFEIVSR